MILQIPLSTVTLTALITPLYLASSESLRANISSAPVATQAVAPASDASSRQRVDEITAALKAGGDAFPGRPADDRAAWERLAARPQVARHVRLAEHQLRFPTPELTPELFATFRDKGTRPEYERPFNQRSERLAHFVIAECIEDRGRFLPAIEAEIAAILAEPTWAVPSHWYKHGGPEGAMVVDLATTARAWTLAATDRWLAHRLQSATRASIRTEIRRRVWDPYLAAVRAGRRLPGIWWPFADNNWNAVCHAGVVGSALVLIEDAGERAQYVVAAETLLQHYLAGFSPDGYCSEGMGYWNYGFGHYVILADTVRRATNGRVNWLTSDVVRRIAEYPAKLEIVDSVFPAYSDSHVSARPAAWLTDYLEHHLALGRPEWQAEERPDPPLFHPLGATLFAAGVIMFEQDERVEKPAGLRSERPLRDSFDVAQVFTFRAAPSGPTLGLGFKGGHNDEHHNHNDLGSYVVVLDDRVLVVDPGAEPYTERTFSARRYESRVLSSYGHSVPLVNGRQQSTGRQFAAAVLAKHSTPEEERVTLDLARAYAEPSLRSLERTFRYRRGDGASVEVADRVTFSTPGKFGTALITHGQVVRLGEDRLLIKQDGVALAVQVDTGGQPFDLVDEVLPEKLISNLRARRIGINLREPVSRAQIVLRYEPAAAEVQAPAFRVEPPPATLSQGTPIRIEAEDFSHEEGGEIILALRSGTQTLALRSFGGASGHSLDWTFETTRPGPHALRLRYSLLAAEPARRLVEMNDQAVQRAIFPSTGGWSSERNDWSVAWAGEQEALIFDLAPGLHNLRLIVEKGAMNLDWLEIVPLSETSATERP